MPRSNVARGAAWKSRTRRWLEANDYLVLDTEIVRNMWTPKGLFPKKLDQFGSDLWGVCGRRGYLWVQVKGYSRKRPSLAAAKRALLSYPCPPATRKIILLWKLRARDPEVVEVQ